MTDRPTGKKRNWLIAIQTEEILSSSHDDGLYNEGNGLVSIMQTDVIRDVENKMAMSIIIIIIII